MMHARSLSIQNDGSIKITRYSSRFVIDLQPRARINNFIALQMEKGKAKFTNFMSVRKMNSLQLWTYLLNHSLALFIFRSLQNNLRNIKQ